MRTAKAKLARCPYCVLGDEFGPMTQRERGFICANCGHIAKPGDKDFKCSCLECSNLGLRSGYASNPEKAFVNLKVGSVWTPGRGPLVVSNFIQTHELGIL